MIECNLPSKDAGVLVAVVTVLANGWEDATAGPVPTGLWVVSDPSNGWLEMFTEVMVCVKVMSPFWPTILGRRCKKRPCYGLRL